MRIILDTNVFVSGVFFKGPPHAILRSWTSGAIQLVLSPEILEEYRDVGRELASGYKSLMILRPREFVERYCV